MFAGKCFYKKTIAIVIFLFFSYFGAFMSQIHYNQIELEQVIRESTIIVIAEPLSEYIQFKTLKISFFNTKKKPAFKYHWYNFRINEIIYIEESLLKKPLSDDIIRVYPAEIDMYLDMHRNYYLNNISESPFVFNYNPSDSSINPGTDKVILFLRVHENKYTEKGIFNFSFTYSNSYESIMKLEEVKQIIKN